MLSGDRSGWNLPLPSRETLEFLGQLIACEQHDTRRYERCLHLLASESVGTQSVEGLQAALVAFHYWLLAIENDLPEPKPRQVNLAGANLYGLHIRGRSAQRRLNLVRANFSGCNLRGEVRFENVDLTEAKFTDVRAEFSEFVNVRASGLDIDNADLTGAFWRRCDAAAMTGVATAALRGCRWVDCRLDTTVLPELIARGGTISGSNPPRDLPFLPAETDLGTFEGHSGRVTSCGFSPDGAWIVSGSDDNTLKLWDTATGECLMTMVSGPGKQQAAIDTENNRILWASPDAWRLLRWRYNDEKTGEARVLPAEHFGPPTHNARPRPINRHRFVKQRAGLAPSH